MEYRILCQPVKQPNGYTYCLYLNSEVQFQHQEQLKSKQSKTAFEGDAYPCRVCSKLFTILQKKSNHALFQRGNPPHRLRD